MSRREIPFNPIKTPQKAVSWEEAQAILARRTQPKVDVEVMPLESAPLAGPQQPSDSAGVASAENTLRSHEIQKPLAPESPSGAVPKIRWAKPVEDGGRCYRLSVCGRFSLVRDLYAGKYRYSAFKISSPIGEWRVCLGAFDTPSEAVARCRQEGEK